MRIRLGMIGGTFGGIHTYYLQYLIELVGYYSEDDLSVQEQNALNQLNSALLKYSKMDHLVGEVRYTLSGKRDLTQEDLEALLAIGDQVMQCDFIMDVASLLCYVKRKAAKAGDWPLVSPDD